MVPWLQGMGSWALEPMAWSHVFLVIRPHGLGGMDPETLSPCALPMGLGPFIPFWTLQLKICESKTLFGTIQDRVVKFGTSTN